ncbi:MAG: hypothetical protein NT154_12155 [Verrucomicrobia bacterium]|nr:hypothetical protein [Verrucomicrobiota bacterium]
MRFTQFLALTPQQPRRRKRVPVPTLVAQFVLLVGLVVGGHLSAFGADMPHAGFLVDEFKLTLAPGRRTEALGPFFYSQEKESQRIWAVPPLLSVTRDPETESKEVDFLYPVMTYDRYGEQYRWQLFQILSFTGGPTQKENPRDRFTLFPLYFQQRSSDPSEDYTALFPFYGHLKHRLTRDDIFFVMFPLYSETRKKDVVTENYLWPVFSLRHGDGLNGWKFWPLAGNEHKDVTTQTNGFGDVKTIGGHDKFFALWPLFFNDKSGIGTTNEAWQQTSIPAYSVLRSPLRDSTTVIWPFFNYVDDREKKYHEWDAPWPLIVFARGEGKTTSRVWPLFSQSHNKTLESKFYLWPIYKYNRMHSDPLDSRHTRICFFLYSDLKELNTETQAVRRKVDFWPFYIHRRDFTGNSRLQVIAPLEPFLSTSKSIERNYSPLWSLWRAENNPRAGAASQSLLWNLYRREVSPDAKKCSLLFGLFQYQSSPKGKNVRLFYVPLGGTKAPARGEANPQPARTG